MPVTVPVQRLVPVRRNSTWATPKLLWAGFAVVSRQLVTEADDNEDCTVEAGPIAELGERNSAERGSVDLLWASVGPPPLEALPTMANELEAALERPLPLLLPPTDWDDGPDDCDSFLWNLEGNRVENEAEARGEAICGCLYLAGVNK
ncbi:hypothetical protein [Phaffia rhodozyma]|uniref:Uncharacterized protein n=1 Tax=Phaffia rhodozyma TaxID=264483 RepID=A0A0F7STV0_PHARH|nr:hypothetical protein [Phaffia rhodozyma]